MKQILIKSEGEYYLLEDKQIPNTEVLSLCLDELEYGTAIIDKVGKCLGCRKIISSTNKEISTSLLTFIDGDKISKSNIIDYEIIKLPEDKSNFNYGIKETSTNKMIIPPDHNTPYEAVEEMIYWLRLNFICVKSHKFLNNSFTEQDIDDLEKFMKEDALKLMNE